MVSPADKNGADIDIGAIARSAAAGDAVAYSSLGGFAAGASRGLMNTYRAARDSKGWMTVGMNPPQDPLPGLTSVTQRFGAVSADAAIGIGTSWGSEEFEHPQMLNLWRFRASDNSFELLSQPTVAVAPEPAFLATIGSQFAGASDDFSHVVFQSSRRLVEDAPPEPTDVPTDDAYLYESFSGRLQPVSVLPEEEGGGIATFAVLGLGSASPGTAGLIYPGDYAVSADGRRIFFTTNTIGPSVGVDPSRIYVRQDLDPLSGPSTLRVDAPERTLPDPAGDTSSTFQGASADGSKVFFVSDEKLTDDATASAASGFGPLAGSEQCAFRRCDLYRWDAAAAEGHRLTDLTTSDLGGAGVLATTGSARDGTSLYFIAIGDLASGATPGEPNLYFWKDGQGVRFVATLDGTFNPATQVAGDIGIWAHGVSSQDATGIARWRATRVTPDGRFLLLQSRARLTSYDNAGHYQLYRYDAASGELRCISCNPGTGASTGDAYLKQERPTDDRPLWLTHNLADNGDRVFFDSTEALVAGDTNGKVDVYEWTGGEVHLVSTGQGSGDAVFLDASASGDDVFFTTRQRLVGGDTDNNIDLYDSRVGGGFPEPQPLPPCDGETCKSPLSEVPDLPTPGSDSTHSVGDAQQRPRRLSFSVKRLTAAQKTALARGRAVRLKVAVGGAGTVSATARAEFGRAAKRVASASKTAAAAGTLKLSLRLSTAARHRLRATGRLSVSLAVSFTGAHAPTTQAFTLRIGRSKPAKASVSAPRRATVPVLRDRNGR